MSTFDPLRLLRRPKVHHSLGAMDPPYPPSWAELSYPWQRAELLLYLEELAAPDPRRQWAADSRAGYVCGIDQVIHFFFDDHDFDEGDVGVSLLDQAEVALVQAVKHQLDRIIQQLPNGGDDEYVAHRDWPAVTAAAVAARDAIGRG